MPKARTSSSRRIGDQPLGRLIAPMSIVSMAAILGSDAKLAWCRSAIKRPHLEQRAERRRLEKAPPCAGRVGRCDLELREDRARLGRPCRLARLPLPGEPLAQLVEAVDRVEDAADDELRRADAVPPVLAEPERDVVARLAPEAVELRAEAERDRLAGVASAVAHAEPEVLPVADRRGLCDLATVDEQRHPRIAEAERREPRELAAEAERQLGA